MKDLLLALDVGTSNVKATLARRDMRVLAQADWEYATRSLGMAAFEQDPEDWWRGVKEVILSVLAASGASAAGIAALAVSSQAPTMLALDGEGRPVRPALIWMDRRSGAQAEQMKEKPGADRVYGITGNPADPYYVLSKILWLREHEPENFERTRSFVQANGYINFRLTGEVTIDRAHASITQCQDIRSEDWSEGLLGALSLPRALFPRLVGSGEVIGQVSVQAAEETGLVTGTPVLGGTVDGAAAALEGGVVEDEVAVEMSGTSSVLLIGSSAIKTSPKLTYMAGALPGSHLLLGAMSTTGAALKWFRDELSGAGESYENLGRLAEEGSPGPTGLLFLPYLAGERAPIWDTHAKGTFTGLTMGTSRAEMVRAVMEGAAFALKDNLGEARQAGARISRLRVVGGSAKSGLWLKIKASALNMALELPLTSSGAAGGLLPLLSAYAGEYKSPQEALSALVRVERVIEPVPAWAAYYEERFPLYKKLYGNLRELFVESDRVRYKDD